ncbi:polyhomeotic-like protein 3 isoform 2-T2 [Anableps anableps]
MMDKELLQQSQSEQATNGPAPSTSTPTTPTPPRLIPNPMLLDSPAPTLTPTTSSPPPPLTPAPSVSSAHGPKAAAAAAAGGALSPHILVPAPPKLTSTGAPTLRTYSRPILPSPTSKASSSMQTSSSSSSVVTATAASPLPSPSSTKPSTSLTNGNTRAGPTSPPITPFHTPASPPGRQVQQPHPVGTPGLVRANQSPSPVRQRVSQQALLLGKGLKGSGQDQVLLRAQMLQSLTLRPPPPGTLTIPPSLRLKPPSSAPPPLSRPSAPVFPPLRPRPQPSATATESATPPGRHLSVPPPTLYSPVRAVPLRPRLHSPNSHRATTPRQSPSLQPIAAAPSSQVTSVSKQLTGLKSCPLTQTVRGPSPSQHSPLSSSNHFERSPSAARQLQMIALSSSQQPQAGTYPHPAVQSKPAELPERSSQSKRTVNKDDLSLIPLNPSALPSAPSHTHTLTRKRELKDSEDQGDISRGVKPGIKEERSTSKDLQVEKDVQREKVKQEKLTDMKQEPESERDKDQMEVKEEDQRDRERRETGKKRKLEEAEDDGGDTPMDTSDRLTDQLPHPHQNTEPAPHPDTVKDSSKESKPNLDLTPAPVKSPLKATVSAQTPVTEPVLVETPVTGPVPVKTPVKGPVSTKTLVTGPVSIQTPVTGQAPNNTPVKGPASTQTPVTEPVPVEKPIKGPVPVKTSVKGLVSMKTQVTGPVSAQTPVTAPVPVKIPVTGPASTQTPVTGPVPVKTPAPELVSTQTPVTELVLTHKPVTGPVPVKAPATELVSTQTPVKELVLTHKPATGPVPVKAPATEQVSTQTPVTELVLTHKPVSEPVPVKSPVTELASTQTPIKGLVLTHKPVSEPVPVKSPVTELASTQTPIKGLVLTHKPVTGPVLVQSPAAGPVPEVSVHSQRLPEPQRDLPSNQEDFCENMSTQSDNQSALSSLSSQSPPSSPFITSSSENPPPLLPAQVAHPTDLNVVQQEAAKADKAPSDSHHAAGAEAEPIDQSEDESESQSLGSPWEMKAWPEGRQVLTHLVEGFVIQEGLQPFPVNRSSLLVPEQVPKPQEVNGTNGRPALPAAEPVKQAEPSTDSEEEDGGDLGSKSGHRDRTVLHCQFCGKRGHAHNFMRSKRFCSTSCARGFNVRLTKRLRALSAGSRSERPRPTLNRAESVPGKPLLLRLPRDLWSAGRREKDGKDKPAAEQKGEEEDDDMGAPPHVFGEAEEDDDDGEEDPAVAMAARMERRAARRARRASAPAVTASTPTTTFHPAPSQWSVEEVTAFIHTLPGCSDVAEAFRLQEIDGQALLLLTEDHLMTSMNIKLGPALKICAHINALKNQ